MVGRTHPRFAVITSRDRFDLRRRADDLIYVFRRFTDPDGGVAYKRDDADVWFRWRPGFGWGAWDEATGDLTGRPWDVPFDRQNPDFPPEGLWVSQKGVKAYAYDLAWL
jgi:hypothetical protein